MNWLIYFLFINFVLIKAQENDECNKVSAGRNVNEFYNESLPDQLYEYIYHQKDKPAVDLVELMKQPKLHGISDENWPYTRNENPFSEYYRNGCQKCLCGVKSKRIVNGSFAKRVDAPWQVLITLKRRFNCGGSLLNNLYVLTAAHCMFGYKKRDLKLRFGAFKRYSQPAIYRHIARIWIDKAYNPKTIFHDIAVVKLKTKIRFTLTIIPICLPIPGSTYAGRLATVTGWGNLYYGGPAAEVLKKSQLPVLSNAECRKTGYGKTIYPSQLCAGNKGKDTCSGDSGGPLVTVEKGRYRQIGLVSFGQECNLPNFPGVYTRVTSFINSIHSLASKGGACWCSDSI